MDLPRSIALGALSLLLSPGLAPAQCTVLGAPGFTGCAPGGGIAPTLTCFGDPVLGTTACTTMNSGTCSGAFTIATTGLAPPAVLLIGACPSQPTYLTLGSPICPPSIVGGCFAFVDLSAYMVALPMENCPACASGPGVPIPSDPALVGAEVCLQAFGCTSVSGPCACIAISNGLSITIMP
ncbi:MAG TPA: hypothetical protein VKF62_00920 [Planctomycetota bacterium]|nr:hypothetical protein [Planctomycetota bacterium]